MQKWEYKIIALGKVKELNEHLNKLGEEGWEAVGVSVTTVTTWASTSGYDHFVLLKRSKA